jgi:hypothetical protein
MNAEHVAKQSTSKTNNITIEQARVNYGEVVIDTMTLIRGEGEGKFFESGADWHKSPYEQKKK